MKAVQIGCNYLGTKAELRGSINDMAGMRRCLVERYDFDEENINVLIDTNDSYSQPTGKNIRNALCRLIRFVEPGDLLFIHYSGHDTRLPAETGEDDDTGYDECIVPHDMNLITGISWTKFRKVEVAAEEDDERGVELRWVDKGSEVGPEVDELHVVATDVADAYHHSVGHFWC